MRAGMLLFLGVLTCPAIGSSQVRALGPAPSIYWKEGALVGVGIGLLLGGWLGHGFCGLSDEVGKNCTGGLVIGAVAGAGLLAIPGALIGGQFAKSSGGDPQPAP